RAVGPDRDPWPHRGRRPRPGLGGRRGPRGSSGRARAHLGPVLAARAGPRLGRRRHGHRPVRGARARSAARRSHVGGGRAGVAARGSGGQPVRDRAAAGAPGPRRVWCRDRSGRRGGHRMTRILVVEDNADLAFGLRNNLEIEGYEVVVVEDGTQGLARARDAGPDLMILDLMLPGLDGSIRSRIIRSVPAPDAAWASGTSGSSITNRLPARSPRCDAGASSTHVRPPCSATSSRTTDRPMPVPATAEPRSRSSRQNRSQMRSRSAAGTPGPSSSTETRARPSATARARVTVWPDGPYFTALSSRLRSI